VDVGLSNNKDDALEDDEKTDSQLSATALVGQDVVPEHRIMFRVRLGLPWADISFTAQNSFGGQNQPFQSKTY